MDVAMGDEPVGGCRCGSKSRPCEVERNVNLQ